jgi:hypothetical protein
MILFADAQDTVRQPEQHQRPDQRGQPPDVLPQRGSELRYRQARAAVCPMKDNQGHKSQQRYQHKLDEVQNLKLF